MDTSRISLAIRCFLSFVLFLAATTKLISKPREEARFSMLEAAGITRPWLIRSAMGVLPIVELFIAGWLLGEWLTVLAITSVALLLVLFCIVMLQAIHSGYTGACGCFGSTNEDRLSYLDVMFNLALVALAIFGIVNQIGSSVVFSIRDVGLSDLIVILIIGSCLFGTYKMVRKMETVFRGLKGGARGRQQRAAN